MSRLLVTGATGFVGREVMQRLGGGSFEVHAVSRHDQEDAHLGANVRWHATDLMDVQTVDALLAAVRPTHLLHLAWDASDADYRSSRKNLDWLVESSMLARTFRANGGMRAVFAGTCAEYDRHASLYAASKAALTDSVSAFARADGWRFAWGRIFWAYGPHGAPHRLVPYVIERLLAGEPAHCSPGAQVRDFVHVGDVASGLLALLESELEGPVDIGTGEGTPVRTVVELIARQIGREELTHFDGAVPPPEEPGQLVASPLALKSLGWRPRSLPAGLAETISWYKERKLS